jgi:hypothetical protein
MIFAINAALQTFPSRLAETQRLIFRGPPPKCTSAIVIARNEFWRDKFTREPFDTTFALARFSDDGIAGREEAVFQRF